MRPDADCVRNILLFLESKVHFVTNQDGNIENCGIQLSHICEALPRYSQEEVYYTLARLDDGGYISLSESWRSNCLDECYVNYITYAGHELIEKFRPESVWKVTSKLAGKVGCFSLRFLAAIAENVLSEYAKSSTLWN